MPGKLSPKTIEARRREREALAMRMAGATFQEIAERIGYRHRKSAHRAVNRALDRAGPTPGADELRKEVFARYMRLLLSWWPPATGAKPDRRAATICLSILEDIRKMMGADAPAQLQVEDVTPRLSGLEEKDLEELWRIAEGIDRIDKDGQDFLDEIGKRLGD